MKKLVLISLALCSAAVLAGDQTAPGFDRNAAEAKAKALFERYISRDEMLDRYYERFNNASQGIAVQGSLLRDWDNVTPKFSVHTDLTFCWYGQVFLAIGPEGKVRNAAISTGTYFFEATGPLSAEQCAQHVREIYKVLGGRHDLELVKAEVNEKAPFYASVRFRQLVEGSKFHIDADVEAQVDLRTGAPIDLAIPDIPPLRPPSRQIISEDQAKGAAAEAVYRHLGWADIEVLFHPPQYMIPALAGYANELAPEDIELARTGTAKVIYFGTIRQPRPWGRSQAPTDAWCLVWVDAESGHTLALAPSSKHLWEAQPFPGPARPFSWEGEWQCGGVGGTLTPTVLGAFGHGREVILQRGSEVLTALYDADSGLLQITVGGAKHLARPSKELQRALEKAPGITARPFGAAKAP